MTVRLSIVIPVYNSKRILPTLITDIQNALQADQLEGDYEVILVNDSSPDESWTTIQKLSRQFSFVRGLSLGRNFGQHSATMAGLNDANGRVVVVMDDDLQHPPHELPQLVAAIENGADVCYTRYIGRQHTYWKKLGSRFNNWVATLLLDKPHDLYLSSFKALRGSLVKEVIKYNGPYPYVDGLILSLTRNITVHDIPHQSRHEGHGNYTLRKSISLWLSMATSFSVVPLRIATFMGFTMTGISLLFILFVVIRKLTDPSIPLGWSSLMATVLLVGGVQTFCLGLLGEYLGRSYLSISAKPQFVIRDRTDDPSP